MKRLFTDDEVRELLKTKQEEKMMNKKLKDELIEQAIIIPFAIAGLVAFIIVMYRLGVF